MHFFISVRAFIQSADSGLIFLNKGTFVFQFYEDIIALSSWQCKIHLVVLKLGIELFFQEFFRTLADERRHSASG